MVYLVTYQKVHCVENLTSRKLNKIQPDAGILLDIQIKKKFNLRKKRGIKLSLISQLGKAHK